SARMRPTPRSMVKSALFFSWIRLEQKGVPPARPSFSTSYSGAGTVDFGGGNLRTRLETGRRIEYAAAEPIAGETSLWPSQIQRKVIRMRRPCGNRLGGM